MFILINYVTYNIFYDTLLDDCYTYMLTHGSFYNLLLYTMLNSYANTWQFL